MSELAFIFPGQGAQKAGMGKDFYENSEAARSFFDQAQKILDFDLKEMCFGEHEELNLTEYTQPCMVSVCLAIVQELKKPGRDPREEMPKPLFKSDVLKMEDLKLDMIMPGTVRNVVDFGAFVDIGVKQDGLVHVSELSNRFVKNAMDVVSVGDEVKVKIIGLDIERGKISLSIKQVQ